MIVYACANGFPPAKAAIATNMSPRRVREIRAEKHFSAVLKLIESLSIEPNRGKRRRKNRRAGNGNKG